MKKEFANPVLEISVFRLENIVLASGAVPTNVETAKGTLADDYNVSIERQTIITL